jgi:chromosome segregation ATPase
MGCGSVLGDLFYLSDSFMQRESNNGWRVASNATFAAYHAPANDLRDRLYQMYGEGQITEEIFTALRILADRGQLRPADLAVHRARVGHRSMVEDDPITANALRRIRSRLTQLTEVRTASEKVLADLEVQLSEIDQRVADKEQAAREILERDEESARQRLAEKAELVLSRDRLTAQVQALRGDLYRLDDLCAQLEAKSMELVAVQARSRLNEEMLQGTA